MSQVDGAFVRRIIEATRGPETHQQLLASVGLSPRVDHVTASREMVEADAYYAMIERATDVEDHGLPFRYAETLRVDDLGAFGLAIKTANDIRDALGRLARYILVASDTLEYELRASTLGATVTMARPHHRRGAQLANECALAAVLSVLRQIGGPRVAPVEVTFRHATPTSTAEHWAFFGCPVRFESTTNSLVFDEQTLDTRSRLADEGLSAYLIAELNDRRHSELEPSVAERVHRVVVDSLPDGQVTRADVARRLGMSERTLHRRLADEGVSFREINQRARRDVAESLLSDGRNSLVEVAFLTGFSDQSAFQRAFKTWTGETPLSYRRAVQAQPRR